MKLALIIENNQILQQTAAKYNISINELNKLVTDADPTGRKYKLFILKLLNKGNIRLPEDSYRVKETLTNFQKYQRNLDIKDILKYDSLHVLETALEPYLDSVSKRQGGNNVNPLSLPGVELIFDNGDVKSYKVSDIESLKGIGEGTKWCTRRSYPDCKAEYYIKQYGWIGVVYKNGKPFIQYTPDYEQVMDVNDSMVMDESLLRFIPKPSLDSNISTLINYIINVLKGRCRWPEAEPVIMKDPECAYRYSVHIIKGRWPEAEPIIMKDPYYAYHYAKYIIKGRWEEAEPIIMKDPYYAYHYAKYIIEGRWSEAEPIIMKDPYYAYHYAKYIIKGRWEEAEPTILYSEYNHFYLSFINKNY